MKYVLLALVFTIVALIPIALVNTLAHGGTSVMITTFSIFILILLLWYQFLAKRYSATVYTGSAVLGLLILSMSVTIGMSLPGAAIILVAIMLPITLSLKVMLRNMRNDRAKHSDTAG